MRYGPDDKFWVTVDPTPDSEMCDVLFQASLRDLELQFKGGLTMDDRNPTIHTDRKEAEVDAYGRLVAMNAGRELARKCAEASLEGISRVMFMDGDGNVVHDFDLPERTYVKQ